MHRLPTKDEVDLAARMVYQDMLETGKFEESFKGNRIKEFRLGMEHLLDSNLTLTEVAHYYQKYHGFDRLRPSHDYRTGRSF